MKDHQQQVRGCWQSPRTCHAANASRLAKGLGGRQLGEQGSTAHAGLYLLTENVTVQSQSGHPTRNCVPRASAFCQVRLPRSRNLLSLSRFGLVTCCRSFASEREPCVCYGAQPTWPPSPDGGPRIYHQKSTCIMRFTAGPLAVLTWSRYLLNLEGTHPSYSTVR